MHLNKDLSDWSICDPQHLQDHLPMPYRLIDQILKQTILYNMQLSLHHIQQKKKNDNYEGKVQQYIAINKIQLDDICTLSSSSKYQNYLVAGDRKGNLLIIDIAKKSLYCKKQLSINKRVTFITETTIFDGEHYVHVIAAILNNSPNIYILRCKHTDTKLYLITEVQITKQQDDVNLFPFQCQFYDDGRLLIVKTYNGHIHGYCLPDLKFNYQKVKNQQNINQNIVNSSSSLKKPVIYPIEHSLIQKTQNKITQKKFQIKFEGYQKSLSYKDLITKLKNKPSKVQPQTIEQTNKKDTKKDTKKVQAVVIQQVKQKQKQIQLNQKIQKKQTKLVNGCDFTQPYPIPKFYPFIYVLYSDVQCPRKKSFEKGKNLKLASKIIFGWKNTKQFYSCDLLKEKVYYENIPNYQLFLINQENIEENIAVQKDKKYSQSINLGDKTKYKLIYPIKSSCISSPSNLHLAFGQQDGTISIWNTSSFTLQYNTDKHLSPVTCLQFFQSWKLISGSESGSVHIDNILEQKNQVKRTNIFQPSQPVPICDIQVNQIGVAFVIDVKGNMRVYDLWRNQKISKMNSCNNFAIADNKGKRWISVNNKTIASTIYTNRDYSIFLSIDWPYIPNSKAVQVPQQLLDKVSQLDRNPFKSQQIHIHIIRNFQFLLDHFDGLQNVYKKGYQKGKILNLFSNLQFTQLYDRNFDIPDFGKNINNNTHHIGTTNKSQFSKTNLSQHSRVSRKSSVSKKSAIKQNQNKNKAKLTDQILHPEKFLFQRRKINKKELPTNQKLLETLRQQHKKKDRREIILQNDLSKTIGI